MRDYVTSLNKDKQMAEQETAQFRNDVAFLTQEAERLLKEVQEQNQARLFAEEKLRLLSGDFESLQKDIPPFQVDAKEIGVLRELKRINDRDNLLLRDQNEKLLKEKRDIMDDMENKLLELQKVYAEKKDLMSENFRLEDEIQNMRF